MLKAIESELYRISVSDNYDNSDTVIIVSVKETNEDIIIFSNEIPELVDLLEKAEDLF